MRISDWSSDVCSSDLLRVTGGLKYSDKYIVNDILPQPDYLKIDAGVALDHGPVTFSVVGRNLRSDEHTSELQSLMRSSYAVFCLNKKKAARHAPKWKQHHALHNKQENMTNIIKE